MEQWFQTPTLKQQKWDLEMGKLKHVQLWHHKDNIIKVVDDIYRDLKSTNAKLWTKVRARNKEVPNITAKEIKRDERMGNIMRGWVVAINLPNLFSKHLINSKTIIVPTLFIILMHQNGGYIEFIIYLHIVHKRHHNLYLRHIRF